MFEILQIKGILNIGEITYIIAVNTCTVLAIVLPQDCESILIEILLVYSLKDKYTSCVYLPNPPSGCQICNLQVE